MQVLLISTIVVYILNKYIFTFYYIYPYTYIYKLKYFAFVFIYLFVFFLLPLFHSILTGSLLNFSLAFVPLAAIIIYLHLQLHIQLCIYSVVCPTPTRCINVNFHLQKPFFPCLSLFRFACSFSMPSP